MGKGDAAHLPRRSGRERIATARLRDAIANEALEQKDTKKKCLRKRKVSGPRVISELGALVYATVKLEELDQSTTKTEGLTKLVQNIHVIRNQRWKELWLYTTRHGRSLPEKQQSAEFEKWTKAQVVRKLVKIADDYNKSILEYMWNRGSKLLEPTDTALGIERADPPYESLYDKVIPRGAQEEEEAANVLMFTELVDDEFVEVSEYLIAVGKETELAILEVEDWESPGVRRALHSHGLWLSELKELNDM